MRPVESVRAAVAEPVVGGYNTAVEGASERYDRQHCTREHGGGGEEVRGAEREYDSRGRGMGQVFCKLVAEA
jgi:hypothetical protein